MHLGMFGVTVSEEHPTARISWEKADTEDERIPERQKTTEISGTWRRGAGRTSEGCTRSGRQKGVLAESLKNPNKTNRLLVGCSDI